MNGMNLLKNMSKNLHELVEKIQELLKQGYEEWKQMEERANKNK